MPLKFDSRNSNKCASPLHVATLVSSLLGSYHGPISLGQVNGVAQSLWCCSQTQGGGGTSLRT